MCKGPLIPPPSPPRRKIFPKSPTSPKKPTKNLPPRDSNVPLQLPLVQLAEEKLDHIVALPPLRVEEPPPAQLDARKDHYLEDRPRRLDLKVVEEEPDDESASQREATASSADITFRSIWPWFRPLRQVSPLPKQQQPSIPKPASILRASSYGKRPSEPPVQDEIVAKISSIESDIPSLASTSASSECPPSPPLVRQILPRRPATRSASEPMMMRVQERVKFNPRITIREFHRSTAEHETCWFSQRELDGFKVAAMQRIVLFNAHSQTDLLPTGTGRLIAARPRHTAHKRLLFSHKALQLDSDLPSTDSFHRTAAAQAEMRSILIVDSQDICANLFAKGFKKMLPAVTVVTATSGEEAVQLSERRSFDVVVVEERLKKFHRRHETFPSTGSLLIKVLKEKSPKSLFVGVSAHLQQDAPMLRKQADLVWSKPPPRMDDTMRDDMLKAILGKRGRDAVVKELFAS